MPSQVENERPKVDRSTLISGVSVIRDHLRSSTFFLRDRSFAIGGNPTFAHQSAGSIPVALP